MDRVSRGSAPDHAIRTRGTLWFLVLPKPIFHSLIHPVSESQRIGGVSKTREGLKIRRLYFL